MLWNFSLLSDCSDVNETGIVFYPKQGPQNGVIGKVKQIVFVEGDHHTNRDLPELVILEFNEVDLLTAVPNNGCKESLKIKVKYFFPITIVILILMFH